jgi:uncharacterized membrane protein
MANFCAKCGAGLTAGSRFCPECGAPAAEPTGQTVPPGTPTGSGTPPPATGATGSTAEGLTPNLAALLCYVGLFVTGIVFLVLEPHNRNPDVKFHAWQSIFFNIAIIALSVTLEILLRVFAFMHLGFLIVAVGWLIRLAFLALWMLLMAKAYGGERWKLPLIGELAEKQAAK